MATGQPVDSLLDVDTAMLLTLADVYEQRWTRTDELVASLIEVVDASGWRVVSPHLEKGARTPKPLRVPRPGQRRQKRKATSDDLKRMFGGGTFAG